MTNKIKNRLKQIKDRIVFRIKTISFNFSEDFFCYGRKQYAIHLEKNDLCISRRERFSLKGNWEFAYIFAERQKLTKLYEIFKSRNFTTIKNDKVQYACILAELFKKQYIPPDLVGFSEDDVYEIYVIAQLEKENGAEDRVEFSLNSLTGRNETRPLYSLRENLIRRIGKLTGKRSEGQGLSLIE